MVSVRSWQQAVAASHGHSALSARDLHAAEKAAYSAYAARVREMAMTGNGVLAHDGLNNRMVISNAISLLAIGDEAGFRRSLDSFSERASHDPVHYSAICYGLQAASGFLSRKGRTA